MTETEINLELTEIQESMTVCDLTYHTHPDPILGRVFHNLRARFASTRQEPIIVQWPASWWEHVKQRFFPKWLLAKFPVKFAEKRIEFKLLYPHLVSSLPTKMMGSSVTLLVHSPDETRFWNFNPETPMSAMEIRRQARNELLWNPNEDHCPICQKPIR